MIKKQYFCTRFVSNFCLLTFLKQILTIKYIYTKTTRICGSFPIYYLLSAVRPPYLLSPISYLLSPIIYRPQDVFLRP